MRITCGYRDGLIAGGAQGEAPLFRVAKHKDSYAATALAGGCRGCNARKIWPGPPETTAHLHNCPGRHAVDLGKWRGAVTTHIARMRNYTRKIGFSATKLTNQLTSALRAMSTRTPEGEYFTALKHTIGGALPDWDDQHVTNNKIYNKALITQVAKLQDLYIERIKEWTQFMTTAGWVRHSRWHARDWMKLIWQALVIYTRRKDERRQLLRQERLSKYNDATFTVETVAQKGRQLREARQRLGGKISEIYYEVSHSEIHQLRETLGDKSSPILTWQWKGVEDNVGRIKHGTRCLIQYIRMVYRPSRVAVQARHLRTRKGRWNICAYLVRTYKQSVHEAELARRAQSRIGKICANTRNVQRLKPKGIISYDETDRHRPHIKITEIYKVNRWPRRDKIGPSLLTILHHVWDIT